MSNRWLLLVLDKSGKSILTKFYFDDVDEVVKCREEIGRPCTILDQKTLVEYSNGQALPGAQQLAFMDLCRTHPRYGALRQVGPGRLAQVDLKHPVRADLPESQFVEIHSTVLVAQLSVIVEVTTGMFFWNQSEQSWRFEREEDADAAAAALDRCQEQIIDMVLGRIPAGPELMESTPSQMAL
ncbi:hypothetical protein ACFOY8_15175 [Thalassospira xianhensis]|uniref:Uncharacterized protein n=1 Tax=Thalassospira xianhensis MCCC 1A02616 TaxID=1177929 RepID=A0A367UGT6_9PROT|nr:hypothetical protein [Thalassospira xianhensis]RCK07517.1 hypothetical protein TH5_00045 [Thalassospira xianhensis MCCC 1A02616]